MSSNRKLILEIWGDTNQAKEIEAVFNKYKLDLSKLIICCEKKGQSILVAAGAMLTMKDTGDSILQCECGEVMGFPEEVLRELSKLGNGKIRCRRCDPELLKKLIEVQKRLGRPTGGIARIDFPTKDEDYIP